MNLLPKFLKKDIELGDFLTLGNLLLNGVLMDEDVQKMFQKTFNRIYFKNTNDVNLKILLLKIMNKRFRCISNRSHRFRKIVRVENEQLLNSKSTTSERLISGQLLYLVSQESTEKDFNEILNSLLRYFEEDERDERVDLYFTLERFLFDTKFRKRINVVRLLKCIKSKKRKLKYHFLRAVFLSAMSNLYPFLNTIEGLFPQNDVVITMKGHVFHGCSDEDLSFIFERYSKTFSVHLLSMFNNVILNYAPGKSSNLLNYILAFLIRNVQRNTAETLQAIFACIMAPSCIHQQTPYLQTAVNLFLEYKGKGDVHVRRLCVEKLGVLRFVMQPISFPLFAPFQEDVFNSIPKFEPPQVRPPENIDAPIPKDVVMEEMIEDVEMNVQEVGGSGSGRRMEEEKPTVVVGMEERSTKENVEPTQEFKLLPKKAERLDSWGEKKEEEEMVIDEESVLKKRKREGTKKNETNENFELEEIPKKRQKVEGGEVAVHDVEVNYEVPGDDVDVQALNDLELD